MIKYLIITILICVIYFLFFKDDSYKSKLKYLLKDELTQLCNKTKDNDNNIMIMMFTKGHIEEARNCIYTYKKSTNKNNILVFALDNETKIAMDKENISCYYNKQFYNTGISDSKFGTNKFNIICYLKLLCIYSILKQKINVLWVDTDIVFFKNPFKYFKKINKSIIIQNDSITDNNNKNNLCAGFMYYRFNKISILFLENCIDYINSIYPKSLPAGDQSVINHLKDLSNMDVLSIELFPNGKNYFDRNICDKNKIYIIHNNWIVGLNNKIKRFKENGLWYI